jgi:hypothetical protein
MTPKAPAAKAYLLKIGQMAYALCSLGRPCSASFPGETVLGELPALAPALPADLTVEKLAGRTTGSIAGSLQAAAPVITAPAVRRR